MAFFVSFRFAVCVRSASSKDHNNCFPHECKNYYRARRNIFALAFGASALYPKRMGRPGRKRKPGTREPNGQLCRNGRIDPLSPAQVRALITADLTIVASQEYATPAGRLMLTGEISTAQWAAAREWDIVASAYRQAIDAPAKDPKAQAIHSPRSRAADPDSYIGEIQAAADADAVAVYIDARDMLLVSVGFRVYETVCEVCEGLGRATTGWDDRERLKTGLGRLAAHWQLTGIDNRVKNNLDKRSREAKK